MRFINVASSTTLSSIFCDPYSTACLQKIADTNKVWQMFDFANLQYQLSPMVDGCLS